MWRDVRARRQLARPPGLRVRRARLAARQGPRPARTTNVGAAHDHASLSVLRPRDPAPGSAELARARAGHRRCSTRTPTSGQNDPDGFKCTTRGAARRAWTPAARAARCSRCTSPTATRAANDMVIAGGRRVRRAADALLPAGPPATTRWPRPSAAWTRAPRASSCTRAPRTSRSTRPSWSPCSRSPTSAGCRCWCTPGRGIPALGRHALAVHRAPPGPAADPRPLRASATWPGSGAAAPDHPNLFFDTAWWSPSDLLALFAMVPPGQILFASDAPYGTAGVRRGAAPALRAPGRADRRPDPAGRSAGRWRASSRARSRSTRGPRRAPARLDRRPAARPRAHVPGRRDRADVQRRGADRAAGAGDPRLQGGRTTRPRRTSARRCWSCSSCARARRPGRAPAALRAGAASDRGGGRRSPDAGRAAAWTRVGGPGPARSSPRRHPRPT